jgi:AraC family transcriptional regulator, regulatory protein of adaptative response / DNA-3-methyladenine glycosylase II
MRYPHADTSIAVARFGQLILRQPKTASREPRRCVRSTIMSELLGLSREALDRARRSRDPRFDGKFFIAVLSTGNYCRTICPVRMSAAVRFYATAAEAAEAGFRPCLRCRPEAAPGSPAWTGTSAVVRRALRLIQDGALDTGSVEDLATHLGMGARHLNRLLLEQVGASPLAIAQTRRLHFAKQLLNDTDLPMTGIALAAGYRSVRRFNEALKDTYKKSPREIRKGRVRSGDASDEISLRLSYRPPYDWDHLLGFLASRAIPGIEYVDAQSYARTIRTPTGHAIIQISACEEGNALLMRVRGVASADLFELSSAARRVFDLSADIVQIASAFRSDPLLSALIVQRPGLRIPGVFDPFECAVRAILGQQVSLQIGRTYAQRLVARAGKSVEPMTEGLTHLFPAPNTLAKLDLRDLGLPSARIDAVRTLARAVRDGVIRFDEPVEDVTRALEKLPGVGPWTAQYTALRGLGDPDAFMPADLVLRRAATTHGSPLTTRALEARAEAWRPWRGYAMMHLWASTPEPVRGSRSVGRSRAPVAPLAPGASAAVSGHPAG